MRCDSGVARGITVEGVTPVRSARPIVWRTQPWPSGVFWVDDAGLLRLIPHKLARNNRTVHTVGLSPLGIRVLKGEPLPAV